MAKIIINTAYYYDNYDNNSIMKSSMKQDNIIATCNATDQYATR